MCRPASVPGLRRCGPRLEGLGLLTCTGGEALGIGGEIQNAWQPAPKGQRIVSLSVDSRGGLPSNTEEEIAR